MFYSNTNTVKYNPTLTVKYKTYNSSYINYIIDI